MRIFGPGYEKLLNVSRETPPYEAGLPTREVVIAPHIHF
jgi:hypothetical protein